MLEPAIGESTSPPTMLTNEYLAPGLGGANYEQNVIVTHTEPEIITPARIYH